MQEPYELVRGRRRTGLNEKDMEYLVRLVRSDVRYLKGRSARRTGADANGTKATKRQELADKLQSVMANRR